MSFIHRNLDRPVNALAETTTVKLITMDARFIMEGADSEGRFSLVEHPLNPRGLAAPMHMHTREDEYSFILEGRWGFQLGDTIVYGEPGDLIYKPRNIWHTFWNAGDTPGRLLEVISPSGFEHFFDEFAAIYAAHGLERMDLLGELNERYGFHVDFGSIEGLVAAHGLNLAA